MGGCGIVVEFIGIPGAGKSSVAAALAEKLSTRFDVARPDRRDYRTTKLSRREKLRLDVVYAPSHLGNRVRRLLYDVRNLGLGFWNIGKSWERSRYPIVLEDTLKSDPRQFYILDEWLVHRTVGESIQRFNANIAYSKKFAIHNVKTHRQVFVHVHIDKELACDRILRQDQSYRWFARTKDRRVIREVLARWDDQLQRLRQEMQERRFVCLDIDGNHPIDLNVNRLLDDLAEVFRGSTEAQGTEVKQ